VSINGKIVKLLGTKITKKDIIRVDGKRIEREQLYRYIVLNKPTGYICTLNDPDRRKIVTDLLPKRFGRIFPVGRLDLNSEGLLLLTNDGEIAHRLMHPSYGVEKTYAVKVRGIVEENDKRLLQIAKGIKIDDDMSHVQHLRIKKHAYKNTWLEIIIAEGKNREIRKICLEAGFDVLVLKRRAFGTLRLSGLKPGAWRELEIEDIRKLRRIVRKTKT
jgi:pseudouridine synthase